MDLDFKKAYAQYLAQQKDIEFGQTIGAIIQRAMFPFQIGTITFELAQGMDLYEFGRTLIIEIEAIRDYPFKYKFDERTLWSAYDYEDLILTSIHEPLFKHYRYRPAIPVDDHIILGED